MGCFLVGFLLLNFLFTCIFDRCSSFFLPLYCLFLELRFLIRPCNLQTFFCPTNRFVFHWSDVIYNGQLRLLVSTGIMVFNNISVISWWSVLLVGKTKKTSDLPQTLSHNVVSSTPRLSGIRSHNVSLAGVVWTESTCNKTIYDSIQNWTSLFYYFSSYIHCISNMQFAIRMDAIFVSYFVNASYDAMYTIEMPWNSFLLGDVGSGQLPI